REVSGAVSGGARPRGRLPGNHRRLAPYTVLLDSLLPEFDASRIENRTIDRSTADVHEAVVHADFLDAVRRSRTVRGLFALRAVGERMAAAVRGSPLVNPPEPSALRPPIYQSGETGCGWGQSRQTSVRVAIGRSWGG